MLTCKQGAGGVHSLISKIPWELHIPTYSYCGPNTRLAERLARGDPGINELDRHCRDHDIAYSKSTNLEDQHKADYVLENQAWKRVKSKDATLGERAAALFVTNAMKVKRKMGMGLRRKCGFNKVVRGVKKLFRKPNNNSLNKNSGMALKAARLLVKNLGGKKNIKTPRVLPLPKTGGVLPLLPIFAGLSALGTLTGGAAAVAKTVIDAKASRKRLEEAKRHNKTMESIALGKKGSGMSLKRFRRGYGLYLKKQSKNFQ